MKFIRASCILELLLVLSAAGDSLPNRQLPLPAQVQEDRKMTITSYSDTPDPFSPSLVANRLDVAFQIAQNVPKGTPIFFAELVEVILVAGEQVRELKSEVAIVGGQLKPFTVSLSVSWDGKDAQGLSVADGVVSYLAFGRLIEQVQGRRKVKDTSLPVTGTLTLDNTVPVLSAACFPPANALGWNNSPVTVSFTAQDSGSGVVAVSPQVLVTREGRGPAVIGYATDAAGNVGSLAVSVNLDLTHPELAFTPGPRILANSAPAISGIWSDTLSGMNAAAGVAQLNGTTVAGLAATPAAFTWTAPEPLVDGPYRLEIAGFDLAGNKQENALEFLVDTLAPRITFTTPTANAVLTRADVLLAGTFMEAESGLDFARTCLLVDGQALSLPSNALTSTSFSFQLGENLSEGLHTAELILVDLAGNTGHATTSFTLRTVDISRMAPPVLLQPAEGASVEGHDITFQWQGSSVADRHRIQVAYDDQFINIFADQVVNQNIPGVADLRIPGFPSNDTRFYWRAAFGLGGNSTEFSAGRAFMNTPGSVRPDARLLAQDWIATGAWRKFDAEDRLFLSQAAPGAAAFIEYGNFIDLGASASPELIYRETYAMHNNSSGEVQVSTDGVDWRTLRSVFGVDETWGDRRLDLSAFAGSSRLQVRFKMNVQHTTAFWNIRNVVVRERPAQLLVPLGTVLTDLPNWSLDARDEQFNTSTQQWESTGGWTLNDTSRSLDLRQGLLASDHLAEFAGAVDLSRSTNPELVYREVYGLHNNSTGEAQASTDGVEWTTVRKILGVDETWGDVHLDLSAYAGVPRLQVRFKVRVQYSTVYWTIRDVVVRERPAPLIVPLGTVLTGLLNWSLDTREEQFNPTTQQWESSGGWTLSHTSQLLALNNGLVPGDHLAGFVGVFDLSHSANPELAYREMYGMHNNSMGETQVSADGVEWMTVRRVLGVDETWGDVHLDLSAYAGVPSLQVRFKMLVQYNTAFWSIRNVVIRERPTPMIIPMGTVLSDLPQWSLDVRDEQFNTSTQQWESMGGWVLDNTSHLLELNDGRILGDHFAEFAGIIDLSGSVNPELAYRENYDMQNNSSGAVQVSTDGIEWRALISILGYDKTWGERRLDLSTYAGTPRLHVRFKMFAQYPTAYWKIRGVVIRERPAPVIVPLGTVLTDLPNWSLDARDEQYNASTQQWVTSGGWTLNNTSHVLALSDGLVLGDHYAAFEGAVNLVGSISPELSLRHSYNMQNGYGEVEVSTDGLSWSRLLYLAGSNSSEQELRASLSAYVCAPTLYIRFKMFVQVGSPYWNLRAVVVRESP